MASSAPLSASPKARAVVFDLDGVLLDLQSGAREASGAPRLLPGAERLLRHLECARVPAGLAALSGGTAAAEALASLPSELTARFGAVQGAAAGSGAAAAGESLAALVAALFASPASAPPAPSSVLVLAGSPEAATVALKYGARAALLPRAPPRAAPSSEGSAPEAAPEALSAADARLLARASPLPSLLALSAEAYGLPPFRDQVLGCTPISPPWFLDGKVVRGFGRGSSTLGIPTANLDPRAVGARLADAVTGVYAGWARVDEAETEGAAPSGAAAGGAAPSASSAAPSGAAAGGAAPSASSAAPPPFGAVLPACLSIGYNPTFGNREKTCEPWILADFSRDFYGARLRLAIVSYIRPELRFDSLQALIDGIHKDAEVTRSLLVDAKDAHAAAVKDDAFFE